MMVRKARCCTVEVRFCMAEAHGGRGFPSSLGQNTESYVRGALVLVEKCLKLIESDRDSAAAYKFQF